MKLDLFIKIIVKVLVSRCRLHLLEYDWKYAAIRANPAGKSRFLDFAKIKTVF